MAGYANMGRTNTRGFGANTYAQVGLETEIMGASPEKLISLLFDGAKAAMVRARHFIETNNMVGRQTNLSKAIDIVDNGLCAAVLNNGSEISESLIHSYKAITSQLLLANLHNDVTRLNAAQQALENLAQAWEQITAQPANVS